MKTTKVISNISRAPRPSQNVAIYKGTKKLISDRDKANAFKGVYARVANPPKNDSTLSRKQKQNRQGRKILMTEYYTSPQNDSPQNNAYSMAELDNGLNALRIRRAPGEDGIHNEMLINLRTPLKKELLDTMNLNWHSGQIPQSWRTGIIIPLHKPGKDKTQLESYRPVCLTNTIAKLAERMICTRLRYDLESRKALSPCQSGFRTGRSTVDPLLRLVCDAQHGFNKNQMERTVTTLIDFSRAFDKVTHSLLLRAFAKLKIDQCYGIWFREFPSDR